MIEPQNTTMPLPAAPAAAEPQQGDGIGFGEMLAQTLGAAVLVDPSVVPQIASGGEQHQQSGDDTTDLADDESSQVPVADLGRRPAPAKLFVSLASDGVVVQPTQPVAIAPPVVDDGLVAELKQQLPAAPENVLIPVALVTATPETMQLPKVPADSLGNPMPIAAPIVVAGAPVVPAVATPAQVDSAGQPVPTADPDLPAIRSVDPSVDPAPSLTTATGSGAAHLVDSPQPVSAESSTVDPSGAAKTPSLPPQSTPTVVAEAADTTRPDRIDPGLVRPEMVDPAGAKPAPLRPSQERAVPTNPTPTSDNVTVAMPPVTHVTWPTTTPPRVDLDPQVPIRVDGLRTVATSVTSNSDSVVLEPATTAAPFSVSALDAAPTQPIVMTESVAPASPTQYSALAERVMQAVEMQANQPPPRTMVVDIPEIEGLRLVVSVRGGAQVHVVPTTGSSTPDSFQPFMNELSGVLSERGFVMTGDGRERGNNPNDEEHQQVPFRFQRPAFRRPAPTDNDLRI